MAIDQKTLTVTACISVDRKRINLKFEFKQIISSLIDFMTGRMWDLIVSVPDHCLSFYFTNCSIFTKWFHGSADCAFLTQLRYKCVFMCPFCSIVILYKSED